MGRHSMRNFVENSTFPGSTSDTDNVNKGSTNLIDIENNPSRNNQ